MIRLRFEKTHEFLEKAKEKFEVTAERSERVQKWLGRVESLEIVSQGKPLGENGWQMDIEGFGLVPVYMDNDVKYGDPSYRTAQIFVETEQLEAIGLESMPQDLFGVGNFISRLKVAIVLHGICSGGTLYIVDIGTQSYD